MLYKECQFSQSKVLCKYTLHIRVPTQNKNWVGQTSSGTSSERNICGAKIKLDKNTVGQMNQTLSGTNIGWDKHWVGQTMDGIIIYWHKWQVGQTSSETNIKLSKIQVKEILSETNTQWNQLIGTNTMWAKHWSGQTLSGTNIEWDKH